MNSNNLPLGSVNDLVDAITYGMFSFGRAGIANV